MPMISAILVSPPETSELSPQWCRSQKWSRPCSWSHQPLASPDSLMPLSLPAWCQPVGSAWNLYRYPSLCRNLCFFEKSTLSQLAMAPVIWSHLSSSSPNASISVFCDFCRFSNMTNVIHVAVIKRKAIRNNVVHLNCIRDRSFRPMGFAEYAHNVFWSCQSRYFILSSRLRYFLNPSEGSPKKPHSVFLGSFIRLSILSLPAGGLLVSLSIHLKSRAISTLTISGLPYVLMIALTSFLTSFGLCWQLDWQFGWLGQFIQDLVNAHP